MEGGFRRLQGNDTMNILVSQINDAVPEEVHKAMLVSSLRRLRGVP